jgi:acyl-CoA thioesterase-1
VRPTLSILQRLQSDQSVKIVGFGDSITGVYYHTGAVHAWPELLGDKLRQRFRAADVQIINAGISGNTSAQALARLTSDVLVHAPHLVVVMFGMNDVVHASPAEYAGNLRAIVRGIQAKGAEVVLVTPNYAYDEDPARPVSRISEFAAIMRQVAGETGVTLADAHAFYRTEHDRGPETWMRLMSDPVHPNLRGHNLFADVIMAALSAEPFVATEPPAFPASLPRLRSRLADRQPVRIVAMTPCDTLIATALKAISPATSVTVIPWNATGKSILELEQEVLQLGWTRYRDDPTLVRPDLFVVTAPPQLEGVAREKFYRAFAMILNRAQSFVPGSWDCLPILPSLFHSSPADSHREVEELMLHSVQDKGLPVVRRPANESNPPDTLLRAKLEALLRAAH